MSEEEQVKLVKSADMELIRQYISRDINLSYFGAQAETEFVKLGYISLIELYINRYTLCTEAQKELVKLKEPPLVRLYALRYPTED